MTEHELPELPDEDSSVDTEVSGEERFFRNSDRIIESVTVHWANSDQGNVVLTEDFETGFTFVTKLVGGDERLELRDGRLVPHEPRGRQDQMREVHVLDLQESKHATFRVYRDNYPMEGGVHHESLEVFGDDAEAESNIRHRLLEAYWRSGSPGIVKQEHIQLLTDFAYGSGRAH